MISLKESNVLLYETDEAEINVDVIYEKFRIKQDKEYISSMDEMYKRYLGEINNS